MFKVHSSSFLVMDESMYSSNLLVMDEGRQES